MRQPPYHTGKVAIGAAYQPQQRPHHDRDALRLQEALLRAHLQQQRSYDTDGVLIAACIVIALLALVLAGPIAG